jgi:hypothetical protein
MRTIFAIISVLACSTLAHSQPLDLQEKCAEQAKKVFRQSYSGSKVEMEKETYGQKTISSDFRSRYNTKINKCLMLIEEQYAYPRQNNKMWTLVILTDAYKRRDYANLLQVKTETQTEVMVCELRPSSKKKKRCTSRKDLDSFVAEYMEQ